MAGQDPSRRAGLLSTQRQPASQGERVGSDGARALEPQHRSTVGEPGRLAADPVVVSLAGRCTFDPGRSEIVCGVSGGADSLALVVLACATGAAVTAVHVDHGLRPGGDQEAQLVRRAAERFGARFRSERVEVGDGPNLEARARRARHEALGDDAALGHTAEDQAETVLVALLRGSGPTGVAAMAPGPRHPILALRRAETEALCAHLDLEVVHDPSNDDPRFVRNRIRTEVLPLLGDVAGRDVVPLLARHAELTAAGVAHLEAEAVAVVPDPHDVAALRAAPAVLATTALRAWLRDASDDRYPPDAAALDRVLAVVRGDRRAAQLAGGWTVARSQGRLRLEPPS